MQHLFAGTFVSSMLVLFNVQLVYFFHIIPIVNRVKNIHKCRFIWQDIWRLLHHRFLAKNHKAYKLMKNFTVDLINVTVCLNSIWSANVFKPFATFFFFMSHFQSRNNIIDRLLTSSVSYSRPEYYIESRFRSRRRPTRRKHSSGAFIDRPSLPQEFIIARLQLK